MLKNPFLVYVISFASVVVVYQLNWSELYPDFSFGLLLFLLATFLTALICSFFIKKYINTISSYDAGKLSNNAFIFLLLGFVFDIVYQGDIPLKIIIQGGDYNYAEFGIPTLHVALMTFGGVFSVIRFSDYLYSKKIGYLIQSLAPVVFSILIVNRGAVLIIIISWLFVLIIKNGGLSLRKGLIYAFFLFFALYLFGTVGDIRSGVGSIEEVGKPSEFFDNTIIPKSYFWTYIYVTSPMANFQETINELSTGTGGVASFFVSEMMPDFLSKRILPYMGIEERVETPLITPALNVSTIYARSYGYLGWIGLVFMFLGLIFFIFVYCWLIRYSKYQVPALALLNTLIVFSIFDNMIAFTGMSLQLLWVLFLPARDAVKDQTT